MACQGFRIISMPYMEFRGHLLTPMTTQIRLASLSGGGGYGQHLSNGSHSVSNMFKNTKEGATPAQLQGSVHRYRALQESA